MSSSSMFFPTSLPPRPRTVTGSYAGSMTGNGATTADRYSPGGTSSSFVSDGGILSSPSGSCFGGKVAGAEIYYMKNGVIRKGSKKKSRKSEANDLVGDKRNNMEQSRERALVKDAASRAPSAFQNESKLVGRPTATVGRSAHHKSEHNYVVGAAPSQQQRSFYHHNNGSSSLRKTDKLYDDMDDDDRRSPDRTRAIRQMLYGTDGPMNGQENSPFGFVYGGSSADSATRRAAGAGGRNEKNLNRFSSFLGGCHGKQRTSTNRVREPHKSIPSGWLWQKSLSDGNLYRRNDEKYDDYDYDEDGGYGFSRENLNQECWWDRGRRREEMDGGRMIGMDPHNFSNNNNRMAPYVERKDELIGRTWQRHPVSRASMSFTTRPHGHEEEDDGYAVNTLGSRGKSVPKFFRSISLRNLLPLGGMNKSRAGPAQGKRVSPPTVPGLVSFSSFRVKKSQQAAGNSPSGSDQHLASPQSPEDGTRLIGSSANSNTKERQRFSGSSLGSAGSSYASSASSSDNRSSIGTDDGILPPPCLHSDVYLKDVEEGVLYHPGSQQIHLLKNSGSVDSFSSGSTSSSASLQNHSSSSPTCPTPTGHTQIVDMHQGYYGKGINSGSSSGGAVGGGGAPGGNGNNSAGPNGTISSASPLVTVHVDPHPATAGAGGGVGTGGNASVQQKQQQQQSSLQQAQQSQHHGPVNGSGGNPSSVAQHHHQQHHLHHSHHPLHHHQHHPQHHHLQHVTFANTQAALSMTNHYQTQGSLEDQGIDMTQSPGRESPSSTASSNTGSGSGSAIGSVGSGSNGCRHSTASFDSGRASSTIYQQGVRYSGLSSESSSGSFRHSYHSSSSSLGSIAPEEICNFDVAAMIAQGIPDHEVLNAWLTGIHFECYYQNFIQAGYDMHTISRMTPEDLNAIGVTKPHHRKRLKSEISQLNISDGLPDYIPNSIEEWLSLLKLEEYTAKLRAQGYHSGRQVTNITWEDLEDLGVLKLGHQKKFILAIKRIEDILAGKRIPMTNAPNAYLTPMDSFPRMNRTVSNALSNSTGMSPYGNLNGVAQTHQFQSTYGTTTRALSQPHNPIQQQQQQQMWRPGPQNNPPSMPVYAHVAAHTLTHQPQLHHVNNTAPSSATPSPVVTPQYHPDVISIQVKNGRRKSMENVSAQEPIYGTSSFLPSQNQTLSNTRSNSGGNIVKFEEGDTTPTNECMPITGSTVVMSTSTLPRLLKNKPIVKIMGGNSTGMPGDRCPSPSGNLQQPQQPQQMVHSSYGDGYKSLPRDIGRMSKAGLNVYGTTNYAGTSGTLGKNSSFKSGPPPPPRRGSCSAMETSNSYGQSHLSSFAGGSISRNNMPPPPPNLSCDQFSCVPPNASRISDEFPPPPHPDDLAMVSGGVPEVEAPNSAKASVNIAAGPNTMKQQQMNVLPVQYQNSGGISSAHPPMRNSPPGGISTKSRDPSPVGSDFSDSDLPVGGPLSRGVRRNGSDASFKSNSSTESESIPFANDNAGTIKQQKPGNRTHQLAAPNSVSSGENSHSGTGDVLNDIGNMLADLTDELDAILEQEMNSKR